MTIGRILDRGPQVGNLGKPGYVRGDIRHAELHPRYTGADGAGEGEPLIEVGFGGPGFWIAQVMPEEIGLIADLKVLQIFAESLRNKRGFFGCTLGSIGSHADAIEAGPSSGLEETRQVTHGFRGDGVVLGFRLAFHLAGMRVFGLGRFGCGLPPCELAGVAAQTQHALRRECLELRNQAGVACRKEAGVSQLLHLIREADEVRWHVCAGSIGWNRECDLNCRVALSTKTGCGK